MQNKTTCCVSGAEKHNILQLYTADESPKQAHHAQEFNSAQVLHCVLLAHVGYGVEDGAEQDQPIAQQYITGCTERKRQLV